jgi:hypothetical protein
MGLCCINSVGRSSSVARFTSGSDIEDVEQLVYEAHLVFDMRLTREAMSSADHPHHLEPLHRSGGRLHCLKASPGANDSLQCSWSASMMLFRYLHVRCLVSLDSLGRLSEAREEIQRAIAMTKNLREQDLLANRLKQLEKAAFSV